MRGPKVWSWRCEERSRTQLHVYQYRLCGSPTYQKSLNYIIKNGGFPSEETCPPRAGGWGWWVGLEQVMLAQNLIL